MVQIAGRSMTPRALLRETLPRGMSPLQLRQTSAMPQPVPQEPSKQLQIAAKATVDFMKKKKGYWGSFGAGFRLTAGQQTFPTLGA